VFERLRRLEDKVAALESLTHGEARKEVG
jgi:hypothetical protein